MKSKLAILGFLLPFILNAQLNVDGKTTLNTDQAISKIPLAGTLLFSGSSMAPFGIKYQYCKFFGGYGSLRTDFNNNQNWVLLTGGVTKSIGNKVNTYLGLGLNLGYEPHRENPSLAFEGGFILKMKKVAFELGLGLSRENWDNGFYVATGTYYHPYSIFGLGFRL